MEFINERLINSLIGDSALHNPSLQSEILDKAKEAKGITLREAAALLNINSPELYDRLFTEAKEVKERIYGNRLVMFAPLYLTNACVNNCLYCAFRTGNKELVRRSLSLEEIRNEAEILVAQGHKRLLLVCGEHPKLASLDFVGKAIEQVYAVDQNGNNIRRVNINIAPLSLDEFKVLKSFGIGTYQIFQETYHFDTYMKMHLAGPKRDFAWRIYAPDRALMAGIDDVGIGALFGLTDYRFETLALLSHAFELDTKYGIGPHTISIPRLEPAINAPAALQPPHAVDDLSFKKLVAVIRLAVPYTGMILSTRERAELRRELFTVGISQISAGSRTSPGSYKEHEDADKEAHAEQFQLGDHRSLDEVVADICSLGYMPSFCTACYRSERTGDRFMELAKSGNIGKICVPNALATFKEYLNDYGTDESREQGLKMIEDTIEKSSKPLQNKVRRMIERIDNGEKDVYF
ncbi:MAG: Cyclic dehypoxanthine futalosine synthase [Ignavibacteriaceae bacterium]|nr:Cyclic dehypoxanthine futalosine synthase [Ignavibacteriaceae bacterium]MCK6613270.1 [FeFe] hydrogenase H-cluster radical SAM maturase HydG [Ignavibacteriaceae bacterium]